MVRAKLLRWWPLIVLVMAGAGRWMVAEVRPEMASTLGSVAVGSAWAAAVLVVLRRGAVGGVLRDGRGMLAGAMLLGGPACALLVRGRNMDAIGMTMALALTPVAVAIAASALGEESGDGIAGRIWPGLAAVSGLLLVLVQPSLGDVRSDVGLAMVPVLTGVGAALFCSDRAGKVVRGVSALVGAGVMFGLAAAVFGAGPVRSVAVAWDGVMALLGVVALGRLGAVRWSAQFALVPLLVLVEGMVLVRQGMTTRWVVGLVLLGVASGYLLLPGEGEG